MMQKSYHKAAFFAIVFSQKLFYFKKPKEI